MTTVDPRDQRIAELERENEALRRQVSELLKRVDELERRLRKEKRQACRFGRAKLVRERRKPGRPMGHPGAASPIPTQVTEEFRAPLRSCPECGGEVSSLEELEQFVIELPEVRPLVRRVVTERGWCRRCRKTVRSTHPAQVSCAGGSACVSLGPRALGLAAELKHRLGIPYRKVADLFQTYFGLRVTHSALVQTSPRLGALGQPTYAALLNVVRHSAVVHTDDTGWKIDTLSAWLWVFGTPQVTLYVVSYRRGLEVVTDVLGEDFAGTLVSDGLPALDGLDRLGFQRAQCLGHLVHRAVEMEAEQGRGAVRFPRAIRTLLQEAIYLAHRHGELTPSTMYQYARGIERRMDLRLQARIDHRANLRLWNHLLSHRRQLFASLYNPAIPPTNNLAERELRGAVVTRKIGGCNRSELHAHAHAVLASVAQTAHRNGLTLSNFVTDWLRPRDGPPMVQGLMPALQLQVALRPRT